MKMQRIMAVLFCTAGAVGIMAQATDLTGTWDNIRSVEYSKDPRKPNLMILTLKNGSRVTVGSDAARVQIRHHGGITKFDTVLQERDDSYKGAGPDKITVDHYFFSRKDSGCYINFD